MTDTKMICLLGGVLCAMASPLVSADGGGAYSIYDQNSDGYLDRAEYENFRQGRPRRERNADTLKFYNVDSDDDEKISGEEMVKLLQRQMQEKLKAKRQ